MLRELSLRAGVIMGRSLPGLIVDEMQPGPAPPDAGFPDVEICRDASGNLLAYCHAENGALHVNMPDLVSFSYKRGASHVRAIPHRPFPPKHILAMYHHCVLPL